MKRDFLRRVSPPAMGDEGWNGCEEDIVDRGVFGGVVVQDESIEEQQRFERQGLGPLSRKLAHGCLSLYGRNFIPSTRLK
jgi:hypothetical protein